MKERPILMNGAMVRATRKGQKTQTRRTSGLEHINESPWIWHIAMQGPLFDRYHVTFEAEDTGDRWTCACPYGQPGDQLWVRETWHVWGSPSHEILEFRADCSNPDLYTWKPSIHMPRRYSRITLEVVGIKAERLHHIGELSAKAEGVEPKAAMSVARGGESYLSYCEAFSELWDQINAKRGYGWNANPWVWVVEFKAVQP